VQDRQACSDARRNGNLEVLKSARKKGCPQYVKIYPSLQEVDISLDSFFDCL